MELKNLILLSWGVMVLLILNGKPTTCRPGNDWEITRGNYIEDEFETGKNMNGAHDRPDNSETFMIHGRDFDLRIKNVLKKKDETSSSSEEEEEEEIFKQAKKEADEDLLNGLNMMLKKNETLEDVFRKEKFSGF